MVENELADSTDQQKRVNVCISDKVTTNEIKFF